MNLRLYEPANMAIIALQARLIELNPRKPRRTKAELVAKAIDAGLTAYHTSDKALPILREGKTVFVRVALDETAMNAAQSICECFSVEQAYNALAKIGAERLLQNQLKTKPNA